MIYKYLLFSVFVLLLIPRAYSQTIVKQLRATRTTKTIKIDGVLDDEAWKEAESGGDFIELRPALGVKEKDNQKTAVKIMYDDAAIYVYARMNDVSSDSIARQIVPRDQVGNADFIGVIFDTYHDKINGNGFYVTAAGSQYDAKYSQTGNEDDNWNSVWFSAVSVDARGWSAEMKIPYSALRFSSKDIQTWGLNFTRRRQKFNQQLFWNKVDPNVSGFINQEGELTNIANIKAPLRLSMVPYISSYLNNYPYNKPDIKNTTTTLNGGMDVKYGINNAFTLDMTLVPDFGQVQSDNQVLNLSPFEVKFNENRQFFTEGTELFNKGNLFYSRRIGSFPTYVKNVESQLIGTEKIVKKSSESKLINATKISGRTASGLGIGLFNAVTNNMQVLVRDDAGNEREIENQPLTNYSILVLDQSLKNNSSVTFLNTNVLREGAAYDADVSALLFRLNNKKNKYFVSGEIKSSYLTSKSAGASAQRGYNYELGFGKQSGSFTWRYEQELSDNKYNPGDLGFFQNNNFLEHELNFGYNNYKANKLFNQLESWLELSYSDRLAKRQYQSSGIFPGVWVQFKNFWTVNVNADWKFEGNNFYEARSEGRLFREPANHGINANFNTNRVKKYQIGGFAGIQEKSLLNGWGWGWGAWQTYRLNDRLSVSTEFSTEPRFDYVGWVDNYEEEFTKNKYIIFSRYDRQTVESIFSTKYTFSPRMGLTLRARHYWSERENRQFYSLNTDGSLSEYSGYSKDKNQNYNTFNIDMIYTWQFAPGSELSVAYKDAGENSGNVLQKDYTHNFSSTINAAQNNSLSVKLLYYLDYLNLKKLRVK